MSVADNKAVVRDFLERFSKGDVDGLLRLFATDGEWWVSGSLQGISGTYDVDAFGELLRAVKDVYVNEVLEITPLSMIGEDDRVAVEATSYAELKDGRVYANRYHLLFELQAGKVRRVKEYMDTHHAYEIFVAQA